MRRRAQWFRDPFRLASPSGNPWRAFALACIGLSFVGHPVASASTAPSVVREKHDFDARGMLRPGPHSGTGDASFSLAGPGRFSMSQRYSLMAQSGPAGSMSSGLYLNTLSYRVSPLLTASVDVGFHTPLHSTVPGIEQDAGPGAIVLPRMGLEYRPSDRWSLNLELYNGPDAFKAYGGHSVLHPTRGSRVP